MPEDTDPPKRMEPFVQAVIDKDVDIVSNLVAVCGGERIYVHISQW